MSEKFCVDCRWHEEVGGSLIHRCMHPSKVTRSIVTGARYGVSCHDARALGQDCGPDGARWEPKLAELEELNEEGAR